MISPSPYEKYSSYAINPTNCLKKKKKTWKRTIVVHYRVTILSTIYRTRATYLLYIGRDVCIFFLFTYS